MRWFMRSVEMAVAVVLFLDGFTRLVVPVPGAPAGLPWLAGLTWMAQCIMFAVGGVEITAGLALLFPVLLDVTDRWGELHPPQHGARA